MLHTSTNPLLTRRTKIGLTVTLFAVMPISADAALLSYEGDIFPEDMGFERFHIYEPERWIDDGWFFQHIDADGASGGPYDGDYDRYEHDLSAFVGDPFFVEWCLMSDAPDSEVHFHNGGARMILNAPGLTYHFNMSSGLALILRGYPYPTEYFDIEPGVPHSYRLEVYGGDYFEFRIDGAVMDFGEPEDVFPTPDAELFFGARYYQSEHTTQWDYVHFGAIPEPTTGLLLVFGTAVVVLRRRLRCEYAAHTNSPRLRSPLRAYSETRSAS